jgi:hypothetical protein
MIMTKQYRMLIVYNCTEKTLDQEKIRQHMEFAGFHIISINMNPSIGSHQNAEIYYESDIPFPFTYASCMIREQNLDTEVAFLQEVQNQDSMWENIKRTLLH